LVSAYGDSADYLLGMPMSTKAARLFLNEAFSSGISAGALHQIQWLVDTPARMNDYLGIAMDFSLNMRISVEIDVGLHRGGAPNTTAMLDMLDMIAINSNYLNFSGFMGYDGHVPNNPFIKIGGPAVFYKSLAKCAQTYSSFVKAGKSRYPAWFSRPVSLNGAGSLTIAAYRNLSQSPLNDYSVGSAFMKPADFDFFTLVATSPALRVAGPILKFMGQEPVVPYVDDWWRLIEKLDPNDFCQGFFVEGGGFPATVTEIPRVVPNPFYGTDSGVNLLPTQGLYHANCSVSVGQGDHVFFRPKEADLMVAFKRITLLQGPQHAVAGTWSTIQGN